MAQTAADLRAGARQVAGEITAKKSAGGFDATAQQRAIEALGRLSLGFIELCDKAANVGAEGREREALLSAYQAISTPLDEIYDQSGGNLERMAKKIMDDDGDLEALYEAPTYKQAQIIGAQALYYLNWLHYYGARLHEGAQRKALLEQAQRGFSEFAVGEKHSDLLVESLLGRGLCYLELGNIEFAAHDLRAVADDSQASAERRGKARLALLDGYVRDGNVPEALKLSEQMLGQGGRAEDNLIRFLRIRALLDGAKKASGTEAEHYRQQALALMDQLRKAGGGWDEKVAALAATGIDNPEQWAGNADNPFAKWELAKLLVQKNDYKQALPLLEGFINSNDAAMRVHQSEAHYFLGLAKFQAGQHEEAATQLDAALKEEKPPYGADAAYVRFKAREALAAKNPEAASGAPYEQAVRDYVSRYPDHKFAYEAQFRLGELLHAQHKFGEAIDAYRKVSGDPAFELRAEFGALQSRFELLQAEVQHPTALQRDALLKEIGTGLQQFDRKAAEFEKAKAGGEPVPMEQMRAKTAIMKAVYVNLQPQPDMQTVADTLSGFEKKYPDQKDLLPQAVRVRLVAYEALGRFADAEADAKAYGSLLVASYGTAAIEELAVGFIREGAKRNGKGDHSANDAAQQVALQLYEHLSTDNDGSAKNKLTLARLYENTGELKKAADLYGEALAAKGDSLSALRGLGRIAETDKRLAEAQGYWQQFLKTSRPGDAPWYEGQYQIARLTNVQGRKKESCDLLDQLKPNMPGLSDIELRGKLDELYKQVCR